MAEQEPADLAAAYVEEFRRPYRETAASIRAAIPDPVLAFRVLEEFDKQLLAVHNEEVTRMKAQEIVRSHEQEPGSLAKLGKRHNRSKARIAQYLEIAETAAEEEPCASTT